jgi:protein SCO1/2
VTTAPLLLMLVLAADPLGGPDAPPSGFVPPAVVDLAFEQKPGSQVPLDTTFRDEQGRTVKLGDYIGRRPVILVLAYYRCPQLCTLVLNGLLGGLKGVPFQPGKEFEVVTVSFDPRETPDLAAAKKASYVDGYGRPGAENAWHFLTGDKNQIDLLAAAVGFHYAFDEKQDRYNHPSGVIILTPEGKVSRYLFGIRFLARDLKLGLVEASEGKVGSVADQLMLFCFHYDPAAGNYSIAILNVVRAAGAVTVLGLGLMAGRMWWREMRKPKPRPEAAT